MKITRNSKIRTLILAAALSTGLGFVSPVSAQVHSYILDINGVGIKDLGTLGGKTSAAYRINDAGQVVGSYRTAAGTHAFITGPNGVGMTDLNSLLDLPEGAILIAATDINNNGQIIATGVPEPETYALMLAGLILVGFMVGRKRLLA